MFALGLCKSKISTNISMPAVPANPMCKLRKYSAEPTKCLI